MNLYLNDATILITGGTGTFGQALVKRLLNEENRPRKIVVYSRDEYKQAIMLSDLIDKSDGRLRFFVGDVRDFERLKTAMDGVQYVVHAAALKNVPSCEYNPFEAVKTNILGSQNVIKASIACRVEKTILLSSDKAVNPINLYGATKLCAEKLFIAANTYGKKRRIKFSCVRYGNVLGSRGSVLQVFNEQIYKSNRITITDPEMTRFWWTVGDSVEFVIKAIRNMNGGEVFIPKLMSSSLLELSFALLDNPSDEFIDKLNYIGIRPGEKMHELLVAKDEIQRLFDLDWCYYIRPDFKFFNFKESGQKIDLPFSYNSNDRLRSMNTEELRILIERAEIEGEA